jgi:hypothetical protein
MPVTSNLKKQVDLPIYEWLRPVPTATTAISSSTSSSALAGRYLYYVVSTLFYRYDTYSDSWHLLASPITTLATLTEIQYNSSLGYYGQAIGPGTGSNTIEMAAFNGKSLVGYKIRILSGKGAGQERTITDVSDPIIKDRGIITTVSQLVITDASTGVNAKQWKSNEYKNYQVRIDYGAGVNYVRKILYNNATTLTIYDPAWTCVTPWWGGVFPVATSTTNTSYTNYQIESNVVTVDSAWDINPDSTSKFVVLSGGIWCVSSQGGNPYFNLQYYDVIADTWYRKSVQAGHLTGGLGTDISFERFNENGGPITSGTSTSITSRALYNTGILMETGRYANLQLRIKNGSGNGQFRTILTNTSTGIYLTRDWDITPNQNSNYEIYRDIESIYMIGHGISTMFQYNLSTDQWTPSKQLDFGVARNISYFISGENDPIGISSIARTTNGIYSASVNPISGGTGYLLDQVLTIAGGSTNGTARITSVNLSGAVLSISMQTPGAGYTSTGAKTTTVNPLGGAGCAIDIISTGDVGTITTAINHNAKIDDVIFITGVTGAAGFEVYNGYKRVVGSLNSSSTVFYITGNFPVGTPLSDAQSTTRLVDVNKNWISGEHVGKLVQIAGAGPDSIAQARRILSNTQNALTFATATAPTNGVSKYVIHDVKLFGTDRSIISKKSGSGRAGIATGGTTTSLTDSTKNWPSFYWANTSPSGASNTGRKVRIVSGTGAGNEMIILSNDSNTLYFAAQSFVPDQTSVYVIMENFGTVTSGSATTLVDTTQNWITNYWVGKRVRITSGTGQANEYLITANTQTTLTFGSATAPDSTSTYAILDMAPRGAGIHIDAITNSSDSTLNNKYLYFWRGGATTELARYNYITEDIEYITYVPYGETLSTGSMYVYDGGDRIYFTKDATGRVYYFDITKNIVVPSTTIPYGMGSAIIGNRIEIIQTEDGLKYLYIMRHSSQEFWRTLLYL